MRSYDREDYAVVGQEPKDGQPKKEFLLPVEELRSIDPVQYFITTGEAVDKIDVLIDDLKECAKQARSLKKKLLKSKGESKWLETSWDGNRNLIVKKKEARPRSPNVKNKNAKKKNK